MMDRHCRMAFLANVSGGEARTHSAGRGVPHIRARIHRPLQFPRFAKLQQ